MITLITMKFDTIDLTVDNYVQRMHVMFIIFRMSQSAVLVQNTNKLAVRSWSSLFHYLPLLL